MVWTQTQQVVHGIRPVMGSTQRTNVRSFRVETYRSLQLQTADLTTAFIELFEPAAQEGMPNNSTNGMEYTRGRVVARRYSKLREGPWAPR